MDTLPGGQDQLLASVSTHLANLASSPTTTTIDSDLLLRASRALDTHTPHSTLWSILSQGESLLHSLPQDLRPLTRLLERTVSFLPFDQLKTTVSTQNLVVGLTSGAADVQLLCLAYLAKAAERPSGAAFVAGDAKLVGTLVGLWLSVESTEVAERAGEVVLSLLLVDCGDTVTIVPEGGETEGMGLMWRRVFLDGDVYRLLFEWTSLVKSNWDLGTKKGRQAATVAQGRLFDFVAGAARMDWASITTTVHGEVEREFSASTTVGGEGVYGGLLRYTATGMIDSSDYLMEVLRRDFFANLLHVVEEENSKGASPALMRAIKDGAGVQEEKEQISTNVLPLR